MQVISPSLVTPGYIEINNKDLSESISLCFQVTFCLYITKGYTNSLIQGPVVLTKDKRQKGNPAATCTSKKSWEIYTDRWSSVEISNSIKMIKHFSQFNF